MSYKLSSCYRGSDSSSQTMCVRQRNEPRAARWESTKKRLQRRGSKCFEIVVPSVWGLTLFGIWGAGAPRSESTDGHDSCQCPV